MGELEKKGILLMADLLIPSLDFWQFKSYYFFQEIYTRMYCKLKKKKKKSNNNKYSYVKENKFYFRYLVEQEWLYCSSIDQNFQFLGSIMII